jgi:hypothetical protein
MKISDRDPALSLRSTPAFFLARAPLDIWPTQAARRPGDTFASDASFFLAGRERGVQKNWERVLTGGLPELGNEIQGFLPVGIFGGQGLKRVGHG